jgi:mercuric ion transport protein
MQTKKFKKLLFTSLLASVSASLCCITPVLALVAGTSGTAAAFSWLEPFRPYLITLTIGVLSFAWYQQLKPKKEDKLACACDDKEKPSFWQSKKWLAFVSVFALLMLAFPNYAEWFYPPQSKSDRVQEIALTQTDFIEETRFSIKGMTCQGCATHVEHEVNKLKGVISVQSSYADADAVVAFDTTHINLTEIIHAINGTGYQVIEKEIVEDK